MKKIHIFNNGPCYNSEMVLRVFVDRHVVKRSSEDIKSASSTEGVRPSYSDMPVK